jgi:hypothetical protein
MKVGLSNHQFVQMFYNSRIFAFNMCDVLLAYFQKNVSRLVKSPVCLSVCLPVCLCVPQYLLNCLLEFHDIWYRGNALQGDLDAVIFNPIASDILKLLTFEIVSEPC